MQKTAPQLWHARGRAARWWLNHIQRRKRKPLATATLKLWKGCLDKWINLSIGDLPLFEASNAVLQTLVAQMSEAGLSPKRISDNYVPVVKMVVASAVDEQRLVPNLVVHVQSKTSWT